METPCNRCAQRGLLFGFSAARKRTEWPKKIECPFSQQSSLLREKQCVSGRVKHGMGRGAWLLLSLYAALVG